MPVVSLNAVYISHPTESPRTPLILAQFPDAETEAQTQNSVIPEKDGASQASVSELWC